MIYTVQVKVMPLKELLDPQGKAVMTGLKNLGCHRYQTCASVKIFNCRLMQIQKKKQNKLRKKHPENCLPTR